MNYELPNNRTLELNQEECAESPREWDNLSKLIFVGGHKHLGDNHTISFGNDFDSRTDFIEKGEKIVRKNIKDIAIIKAVHLYEHGGIALSTSRTGQFDCRWDSGTCGFVVVTKGQIRENFGVKRVTKELLAQADRILEDEIKTLNQYLCGGVYYFTIENEDGETEDSCGGFYGDDIQTNGVLDHIGNEDREYILESLLTKTV